MSSVRDTYKLKVGYSRYEKAVLGNKLNTETKINGKIKKKMFCIENVEVC